MNNLVLLSCARIDTLDISISKKHVLHQKFLLTNKEVKEIQMADRRNAQSMKVLVDKGYKGVRSHGRRAVTPHEKTCRRCSDGCAEYREH